MKRVLKSKRLRWLAIGAAARFVIRRSTSRSVDRATADIEERLPARIRAVVDAVPADAVRAGGSVVVAGRTARRFASGTRTASKLVSEQRQRLGDGMARIRSVGDEVGQEVETRRRELTADYLRTTRGQGAADDALLDMRIDGPEGLLAHDAEDLPPIKQPVRRGRWRSDRRLRSDSVNRVQRTYRQPTRPWDR